MGKAKIIRHVGTLVKNIETANVVLDFDSIIYDENEHAPKIVSITVDDKELVDLKDYYAVSIPQIEVGNYNIVINGTGLFGGVKQVPWSIKKAQGKIISVEPKEIFIQGSENIELVEITYEGDGDITVSESPYVTSEVMGYDPIFGRNNWEQIARACMLGEVPDSWKIGDTKPTTLEGVDGGEYHVQIIGKNHDNLDRTDKYYNNKSYNNGTNKAALTLQFVEALRNDYIFHLKTTEDNYNWSNSELRTITVPQVLKELEPELASILRTVTKHTQKSYNNHTLIDTADKLFILCLHEATQSPPRFDNSYYNPVAEGECYDFFESRDRLVKSKLYGSPSYWFVRSEIYRNAVPGVTQTGGFIQSLSADEPSGVVFTFCI